MTTHERYAPRPRLVPLYDPAAARDSVSSIEQASQFHPVRSVNLIGDAFAIPGGMAKHESHRPKTVEKAGFNGAEFRARENYHPFATRYPANVTEEPFSTRASYPKGLKWQVWRPTSAAALKQRLRWALRNRWKL